MHVLAALTFDDVLRRTPAFGTPENPTGSRLVSIVFANPGSSVWDDLLTNRAFLDDRSGEKWDLFFAGLSAYGPSEPEAQLLRKLPEPPYSLYHNPRHFRGIEQEVRGGVARASQRDSIARPEWRYSGGTDLVSFMCHGQEPDWLSLAAAVDLEDGSGSRLGAITEELADWNEPMFASDLAPGSAPGASFPASGRFAAALIWSASAVTGGTLGNAAYDLIKLLLR